MLDEVALQDRTVIGVSIIRSWKAYGSLVAVLSIFERHRTICVRVSRTA